jgi:multicomponent Na+:H+ antiporter subunit E
VRRARLVAGRTLLLALVWWALAEGDASSWPFALAVVPLALAASLVLAPRPLGLRPLGAARFAAFFLRQSLAGGVDVARRAFAPSLPIAPAFARYELRLPPGAARVVLVNAVSLLPGTVSVALRERTLELHVLDTSLPVHETLAALEERVAAAAGLELGPRPATAPGRTGSP